MNRFFFTARGFSLIELLVVMAILAIMFGVVIAALGSSKRNSYDARRKADLREVQGALNLYYQENGQYPSTGGAWWGNSPNGLNKTESGASAYIPNLTPGYLAKLPQDPVWTPGAYGGWGGAYLYRSDGNNYKLLSHSPAPSSVASTPANDFFYDPVRPTWGWKVCSAEPACSTW